MTLVTGGAFQGKTDFAIKTLGVAVGDILDGENCAVDDVMRAAAVRNFERLVKRIMGDGAVDFAKRLCCENPDIIVITTEIGGGIIPIDSDSRRWREETGKACCVLAEFAENVYRINCGIPLKLKGQDL